MYAVYMYMCTNPSKRLNEIHAVTKVPHHLPIFYMQVCMEEEDLTATAVAH